MSEVQILSPRPILRVNWSNQKSVSFHAVTGLSHLKVGLSVVMYLLSAAYSAWHPTLTESLTSGVVTVIATLPLNYLSADLVHRVGDVRRGWGKSTKTHPSHGLKTAVKIVLPAGTAACHPPTPPPRLASP